MSSIQSDDQDREGFIPNILKIDEQQLQHAEIDSPKFKLNQPQYILGQALISKQPPETYIAIRDIPKKPISFKSAPTPSSQFKSHLPTARNKFCSQTDYILAYSRQKLPFGSQECKPFQHQIKLKASFADQKLKFRNIRKWKREDIQHEATTDQDLLQFDSKFEGGNLQCAFKSKNQVNTYTLFMHNDTNTNGYNQWFYFSIRNAKAKTPYTIKISNFKKPYSFFTKGLQPLVFSLAQANIRGNGWYRDGQNLSYYPSTFRQIDCSPYYTLEFEITFEHQNDYVTISPYMPYSYSRLISHLKLKENKAKQRQLIWNITSIGKTLGNNQIPYITLSKNEQNIKNKPNIVFFARQHSGQTWSSFLMQELLDELLEGSSCASQWMLQNYSIRIFPMINVDGVIYGNFRCDLGGYDLNRCWKDPSPSLHPQIFSIKQQIAKISKNSSIQFCFDLHTHSKDLGAFAYCCIESQNCRAFPMLLGKITPLFRYSACTFGISRGKQQTLRAEVFNISNANFLTIQMSAFGFKTSTSQIPHSFSINHMNMLAQAVNQGLYSYKTGQPYQTIELGNLEQNEQILKNYLKADLRQDQPIEGSDSQPQIDQIELQVKLQKIFPQHFLEDNFVKDKQKTKTKLFKKIKKVSKQPGRLDSHQKSLINFKPKQENRQRSKTQIQPEVIVIDKTHHTRYLPSSLRQPEQKKTMFDTPKNLQSKKTQKKIEQEIRTTKPLNFIQFSLKKLPIFSDLQSIGLPKKQAYRYDKTSYKDETNKAQVKDINKGIKYVKGKNDQQQLPYLCIMSQTKRQMQIARIRERRHNRNELNRTEINRMEVKYLNSSLDHQKNLNASLIGKFTKNKSKNTIQTSSKMWMFNYSRYGQSIDKRYF